jgi:hypothetical protein
MSDFLRIFLLNPNFLLVHRNRYSERMDDGQKTPCGHPDFKSYVKILRVFIDNRQTNRQRDRRTETLIRCGLGNLIGSSRYTCYAWAGGTFLRCLRWTTHRKLHVDTLILIPTFKIYVFSYSRQTETLIWGGFPHLVPPGKGCVSAAAQTLPHPSLYQVVTYVCSLY